MKYPKTLTATYYYFIYRFKNKIKTLTVLDIDHLAPYLRTIENHKDYTVISLTKVETKSTSFPIDKLKKAYKL